jgi:hypothetical protein
MPTRFRASEERWVKREKSGMVGFVDIVNRTVQTGEGDPSVVGEFAIRGSSSLNLDDRIGTCSCKCARRLQEGRGTPPMRLVGFWRSAALGQWRTVVV